MSNCTQKILNLKELKVKNIKESLFELKISVEMPVKEHVCPHCGKVTKQIHDYLKEREIKDLPIGIRQITLLYKPRRYACSCGKHFLEKCEEIMPRYKMTKRFINLILEKTRELRSFKSIAKELKISQATVIRIFDYVSYAEDLLGKVLCIDEFKGNLEDDKYQAVLVNPEVSKVINIYKNRKKFELHDWFKSIPKEKRYNVMYFICDMWDSYIDLAEHFFPKAEICVDRFHYTRCVTEAMNTIRKEIQNTVGKEYRKYMKHSRKLLLSHYEDLEKIKKYDAKKQLHEMLDISPKLTTAYYLLQEFYKVNKSGNRDEAKERLYRFYDLVKESNLKEFKKAVDTFKHYEKYILNSFLIKYTNSYAEGMNTLIKTLKRTGYGYKNLKRFRNRIMHYQNA